MTYLQRVGLPWTKPPLSMNDRGASRGATYAKAQKINEIQHIISLLARRVTMPPNHAYLIVQLNYRPRDNRRRDTDNLIATAKPIYDALAGGSTKIPGLGIVPDDTPQYMGKPEPIIWPAKKGQPPVMWLDLYSAPQPPHPYGGLAA
ncbi:hypothetical protein CPHO_08445 [Corynebacterium phocae]|uniref:Uncharacterized protein n=2 Tax=Corynebacterium phocae TaxID=161895 RepID=A0A1L7D724_9CORY|nr:hypothetical protein CPHO_08445 [Corynebacterium phocae]